MIKWQDRIVGCFGSEDLLFAHHQGDLCQAAALLVVLVENQVSWSELERETKAKLHAQLEKRAAKNPSFDWDHANAYVDKEIKRMKKYFTPWLSD